MFQVLHLLESMRDLVILPSPRVEWRTEWEIFWRVSSICQIQNNRLCNYVLRLVDWYFQVFSISSFTNQDPVGNYTPLKLTDVPVQSTSSNSSKKLTSRSHSTGGGWSSSSDDEENVLEEFSQHLSDNIDNGDNVVNDWCNREDINNLELLSTLQVGINSAL